MVEPCCFKNQFTGEVSIPSTWTKEYSCKDAEVQTGVLQTKGRKVQTTLSSLQTVDQLDKGEGTVGRHGARATLEGLQYVYANVSYDKEKLATFLEQSKDGLLSLLYQIHRSSTFDHYTPNWTRGRSDLVSAFTFSSPHAVENELHALDLSWNATGSMLATGYGRLDLSGWCYNNGYVCVWNILRPDLDEHVPHYTIELDTHVTCVAFHPSDALMIAIGMYSGEVVVIPDVTEAIPKEYSTCRSPFNHREPVSCLQWVQNLQELREAHRYTLCSAGQDGMIAYWTPTNQLSHPLTLFSVQGRHHQLAGIAAISYARGASGRGGANTPSIDGVLLIGLESGDVGRARPGPITSTRPADTGSKQATPLEVVWLDGHRGPVQSLSASPYFHQLFVTCSSDGSAHIYSHLERTPMLTLEPSSETKHFLYKAQFSSARPGVLALVSRSSFLHIYDVHQSSSKPVYSIEAGVDGAPVVALLFNHASADLLATSDLRGCVRVWRLPSDLTQSSDLERAAVRMSQHSAPTSNHNTEETGGNYMRELFGFS